MGYPENPGPKLSTFLTVGFIPTDWQDEIWNKFSCRLIGCSFFAYTHQRLSLLARILFSICLAVN